MSAAVRRAPSLSVRTLGLALAAAVTICVVAVLVLGLSARVIRVIERAPTFVDLIPLRDPPPPEPEVVPVQRVKPADVRIEPAPAPRPETSSAPPQPVDATIVPVAPSAPPPSATAGSGSGAPGVGSGGGGDGAGGTGSGGNGTGDGGRLTATPPDWLYKPDLAPFYPAEAKARGVDGEVLLECRILRTRRLVGCRVLRDRPRGYGFGRAALAAIGNFRATPPMLNGQMLESLPVRVPVSFNNIRQKKR